jgi:Uma2 family endonuclease
MTFTKARFASFEDYLMADVSDLPEERCEYWDGELVPVMTESKFNTDIANYLYLLFVQAGIYYKLLCPHACEIEVIGRPRTRFPDLTVFADVHLLLVDKNTRVTLDMPPPRLVVEVVSPGDEAKPNYIRDYRDKRDQYAAIGIPEYWLVDPEREWVMVGSLSAEQYAFETFTGDQTIVSPTFPELKLTVAQVLAG